MAKVPEEKVLNIRLLGPPEVSAVEVGPALGAVEGAFATAVILHALWDTFAGMKSATFVGLLSIQLVSLLIAITSLTLLIRRVREASHGKEWRTCRVRTPVRPWSGAHPHGTACALTETLVERLAG